MKLLTFVACDKVIIAKEDNNATLISILSEIKGQFELAPGKTLTATDAYPYRWSIFAMWKLDADDVGKTFIQMFKLRSPSGGPLRGESAAPVEFKADQPIHRVVAQVPIIPIGESGEWSIDLFIAEKGQELPEVPIATYPIKIQFTEGKLT